MNWEMAVEVEDLSYTYQTERALIKSAFLGRGQPLALGPNGAGKSTLLLHLNGLLRGQEGEDSRQREVDESLRWVRARWEWSFRIG